MANCKAKIIHGYALKDFRSHPLKEWLLGWKPLHLCWLFEKLSLSIPKYFIGGGDAPPVFAGGNIDNATRDLGNTEDTPVIDWDKANPFIVALAWETAVGKRANARSYRLEWRNKTDSGGWTPLASTGALNWTGSTNLVNGNPLIVGEAICTSSNPAFVDNLEREGANDLASHAMNSGDQWTECQWAIDASGATDSKEYEFRLYNVSDTAVIGTSLATITMAVGAIFITVYPANVETIAIVPDPTITVVRHVTVTPIDIEISVAPYDPTVGGAAIILPSDIEISTAPYDPSIITESLLKPADIEISVAPYDPTVVTESLLTPTDIEIVAVAPTPTISGNALSTPTDIEITAEAYGPTISGNALSTPTDIEITADIPAPTIVTEALLSTTDIEVTVDVPAPTVVTVTDIIIQPIDIEIVIEAPSVEVQITSGKTRISTILILR